ncbi:MAG: RNA 2',3'-cyclic phosphodiesterase [Candidatus Latescibacterota bacterium]
MRTFIAVEIPKEIQERVGGYIETIRDMIPEVKWVSPENLHFTIKFLGEIKNSDFKNIRDCVSKAASEYSPFSMGLSGIGFFPSQDKPKVIWIGADGGEDSLLDIFHDMEQRLEAVGFDRESKTFFPHLTIGRVKKFKRIDIPEVFPDFEPAIFEVGSIAIMKSTLTPDGPIYEKLFQSELKSVETLD